MLKAWFTEKALELHIKFDVCIDGYFLIIYSNMFLCYTCTARLLIRKWYTFQESLSPLLTGFGVMMLYHLGHQSHFLFESTLHGIVPFDDLRSICEACRNWRIKKMPANTMNNNSITEHEILFPALITEFLFFTLNGIKEGFL